jgi:F-box protein 20
MSAEQIDSDLQAVVTEARQWIQAVIGKELQGEFRESLEDGIVLCELMSKLKPGSIRKINAKNIAIAHLDNLKQFLTACESLGLKDSQLFNLTDLQAPGTLRMKTGGVKHTTADRRLRNV